MTETAERLPTVSIIVPVYNVSDHVLSCLESLQAQTWTDVEVLVIDDGSTDESGDIAEKFCQSDARFHFFRQANLGLSGARNTGLDHAKGEYIGFIDSDDRVAPNFLEVLLGALQESKSDWVACAIQSCHPDGLGELHSAIHGAKTPDTAAGVRRYPLDSWTDVIRHFPSAWNKIYRKTLIDGLRFEEGTWFEDHRFFQQVAARTDHLLHVPEPLYLQTRGRDGQITATDSERVFEQFDVLRGLRDVMRATPRPDADKAFARLTTRLTFERSLAIRDPERRSRFAQASAEFMQEQGITFSAHWDPEIWRSWALEIAGDTPLSVCIPYRRTLDAQFQQTLNCLTAQIGPAMEIVLLCEGRSDTAHAQNYAQTHANLRVLPLKLLRQGALWTHLKGHFVILMHAGVRFESVMLLHRVEDMLRTDADMGVTAFDIRPNAPDESVVYHNGFNDMRPFAGNAPQSGTLKMSPQIALSMAPETAARIFSRALLAEQGVAFTKGARPSWALCLNAALAAKHVIYSSHSDIEVPEVPLDGGAVGPGHDAMIKALSENVKDQLPEGWERLLYDRAMRAERQSLASRNKINKAIALGRASLGASLRGLSGPTPQIAGFDSAFGPGSALLLDPVGLAGRVMGRPRNRSLLERQAELDAAAGQLSNMHETKSMLVFPLQDAAAFRYFADFRNTPYANISFYAVDRVLIPFHVSLRFEEQLIVCNAFGNDGWGTETREPVTLAKEGCSVEILLSERKVRVLLNGAEIFAFDVAPSSKTTGIGDITSIRQVDLQGDIRPELILPQQPQKDLALDGRLVLVAGYATKDHKVVDLTSGNTLPATEVHTADGHDALQALLPGRLWRHVPEEEHAALSLQVQDQSGQALGAALNITRAQMAARISAMMALHPSHADSAALFTAIEHVRHGDLFALLSGQAQEILQDRTSFYQLDGFLADDADEDDTVTDTPTDETASATLQAEDIDPVVREFEAALALFTKSQAAIPPEDPLSVFEQMSLSWEATQQVTLALGEFFTRQGQDFHAFHAIAKAKGTAPYEGNGHAWNDSAILPFLFVQNDIEALRNCFWSLTTPTDQWIVTPTIAWVVRQALMATYMVETDRENILYAFMEFVDKRTADYWERAHCKELTYTAAQLVFNMGLAPDYLRQDIIWFCLRNYGLSRQFWACLPSSEIQDLPAELQVAREKFADVIAHQTAPEQAHDALRFFQQVGCRDAVRTRREIFGSAGMPLSEQTAPSLSDFVAVHGEAAKAAIRYMAAPQSKPVSKAVSDLVAHHLPSLTTDQTKTPYLSLQRDAARNAATLLAAPADTIDPETFQNLMTQCHQLSGERSGFLGFAVWIALITGFAPHPIRQEEIGQILGQIKWRFEMLDSDRRMALKAAPAVQMAMTTLAKSSVDASILAPLLALLDMPRPLQSGTAKTDFAVNPLFDTIVTVFSCKPYLDTRIPALRAGWLSLLEALGVPYVIMVGDGDGSQVGDVVHLDAPDDYEGLPQKTLATIRWVHDNTDFTHMLKIDDDCFMNAPLFFHSLSYRKFDYFGRRLTRSIGQLDRVWHQAKSASARGKMDLDKSPEPSSYADGGSGYTLSRTAMAAALDAAASPEGQQLIQVSFMEDKMLGDLLAQRGIEVVEEDYAVTVRRRPHRDAIPVASWQNGFDASLTAPVHLVHMDTHLGQQEAIAQLNKATLTPKKIWPAYQEIQLGYQSNALELVTDEGRLDSARSAEVALVACMRNEMFMLPQFLAHYRKLGVGAFLIADNCSDDGTLEYLAAQPDVSVFSVDTDYRLSRYGVAWQQAMLAEFRVGKWSIVADADELLVWQKTQTETLPALVARPEFAEAEAARIFMLDMYPKGPLEGATFKTDPFEEAGYSDRTPFLTNMPAYGPYSDRPTWTSALRHRLIPGSRPNLFVAQKLALLKYQPWMRLSAGLHYVGDAKLSERELIFAHFKYNADFRRKAKTEVARRQHFNDAEEYRKYLALASEGRSIIYDAHTSAHWTDIDFVKERLDP
ncbi:glycosyltransferase [Shimia sp. R11_0]|uniref:glycosyltransferase n=1 Tax=Shimia sp. R11_0 TaxID=2821096 RepID=UPI001FFE1413|nr:glycosyltransferase [Shimia sp. R11_0]